MNLNLFYSIVFYSIVPQTHPVVGQLQRQLDVGVRGDPAGLDEAWTRRTTTSVKNNNNSKTKNGRRPNQLDKI